jgi:hypothetical protein
MNSQPYLSEKEVILLFFNLKRCLYGLEHVKERSLQMNSLIGNLLFSKNHALWNISQSKFLKRYK